jgi:uncharacterized membrane protein YgcG
VVIAIVAMNGLEARGQSTDPVDPVELDRIVAPIALYTDSLLANVLPASTHLSQIAQAAQHLRENDGQLDGPPAGTSWDGSVVTLLDVPPVLYKMADELTWTRSLGDAVLAQQDDVLDAIQRVRRDAYDAGALVSNDQITVTVYDDIITIDQPSQATLYVPTYDTTTLYIDDDDDADWAAVAVAFTAGILIGSALYDDDCDWWGYGIYRGVPYLGPRGVKGPRGPYDPRGRWDPRGPLDPRGPRDPRGPGDDLRNPRDVRNPGDNPRDRNPRDANPRDARDRPGAREGRREPSRGGRDAPGSRSEMGNRDSRNRHASRGHSRRSPSRSAFGGRSSGSRARSYSSRGRSSRGASRGGGGRRGGGRRR